MDQREKYLRNYEIQFSGLKPGIHFFEFEVDKTFFDWHEASDLLDANVQVTVKLDKKTAAMLDMNFDIKGSVVTVCDRCLEPLNVVLKSSERLIVKFGDESESDDEIVVLPENAWQINVAQYIYEMVILAIPLRRVHEKNACNQEVLNKLSQHEIEEHEPEIDPRWAALKNLNKN